MENHTVAGYLQRLSSKELDAFLWQCMLLHQWDDYARIIPLILEIQKSRNHPISKPILDSYNTYLRDHAYAQETQ